MKQPLPKVPDGPYYTISLKELYRPRPYPKPRKARRLRRRRARTWAAMSPEERALYTFLNEEMMKKLQAEMDKQILYGDGLSETFGWLT